MAVSSVRIVQKVLSTKHDRSHPNWSYSSTSSQFCFVHTHFLHGSLKWTLLLSKTKIDKTLTVNFLLFIDNERIYSPVPKLASTITFMSCKP